MFVQMADGLVYLHVQTAVIVYCDPKSSNVVLDLNLNIKTCDFRLTDKVDGWNTYYEDEQWWLITIQAVRLRYVDR